MDKYRSRREFVKKAALGTAVLGGAPYIMAKPGRELLSMERIYPQENYSSNDKINLALIGSGIQGIYDTTTALQVPGVQLVAVCDLYTGRLERARELWGDHLFTTRDYREILSREDVDAVIVATPDHWHTKIAVDAMTAGKAVYCEKPMVQRFEEGAKLIEAEKKSGVIFQVGSQSMSSLGNEKARQLYREGAIGEMVLLDMYNDRYSSEGAWQYPIPSNANSETVDFDTFLGNAPKRPFDTTRFFRWRNYRDYGTGVAGDLFVHAFSSLHFILDSKGPVRGLSSGGLRYWNDGRDVPDVTLTLYDYPKTSTHSAFNASFRVNFIAGSGEGGGFRMVGTEGAMEVGQNSVKLIRSKLGRTPSSYSMIAYTEEEQKKLRTSFERSKPEPRSEILSTGETEWKAPYDYKGAHYDHFDNFFQAVRKSKPVIQDATFGLRAAGAALLANESYYRESPVNWDPEKMRLI